MKTKWRDWLKHIAQTALMVAVVSVAVDYFRRPNVPLNAAEMPFTSIYQNQNNNLKNFSAEQTAVLYFWGSWCGICKHTSPVVDDLRADGVPVLGVALASGSDEAVKQYLQNNNLQFDSINDTQGKWSQQWGVKVTPTIILIQNGKVVHSTTGLATYWGLKARLFWANWFQAA